MTKTTMTPDDLRDTLKTLVSDILDAAEAKGVNLVFREAPNPKDGPYPSSHEARELVHSTMALAVLFERAAGLTTFDSTNIAADVIKDAVRARGLAEPALKL